jgi:hypothetical protein
VRVLGLVAVTLTLSACSFDTSASLLPGGDSSDAPSDAAPGQPDADPAEPDPDPDPVPMEPAFTFRMNLGGAQFTGSDYPGTWLADDGTCSGNQYSDFDAVNGTVDDTLFQSNRYSDPINCTIGGGTLTTGDYTVTLLFGEIFRGGCDNDNGSREFDVSAEGILFLDDFDAVVANGGCVLGSGTPTSQTFTVAVGDGTLNIVADGNSTNAMLSAVEVVSVAQVPVITGSAE